MFQMERLLKFVEIFCVGSRAVVFHRMNIMKELAVQIPAELTRKKSAHFDLI